MEIKIKLLSPKARIPAKAHTGDAGFDVFLPEDTIVWPGRNRIPLGFALEMPEWFQAQIEPRSGFSSKGMDGHHVVGPGLCADRIEKFDIDVLVGKVDANFRGNVHVIVKSYEDDPVYLDAGLKIAQMTFYELPKVERLALTDTLTESERGAQGFGSSGSK